jgi:hypothetical protein
MLSEKYGRSLDKHDIHIELVSGFLTKLICFRIVFTVTENLELIMITVLMTLQSF